MVRRRDKEEPLFEAVEGKIKKGGLHRSLRVPLTYKFKLRELERLNKNAEGKRFKFKGNELKMTPLMKKRLQLAVNMMK